MTGRILVVDDQRAIAEMMAGVLQGAATRCSPPSTARRRCARCTRAARSGGVGHPDAGMDRLRAVPPGALRSLTALLPIVLVTSLEPQAERINGWRRAPTISVQAGQLGRAVRAREVAAAREAPAGRGSALELGAGGTRARPGLAARAALPAEALFSRQWPKRSSPAARRSSSRTGATSPR